MVALGAQESDVGRMLKLTPTNNKMNKIVDGGWFICSEKDKWKIQVYKRQNSEYYSQRQHVMEVSYNKVSVIN